MRKLDQSQLIAERSQADTVLLWQVELITDMLLLQRLLRQSNARDKKKQKTKYTARIKIKVWSFFEKPRSTISKARAVHITLPREEVLLALMSRRCAPLVRHLQ